MSAIKPTPNITKSEVFLSIKAASDKTSDVLRRVFGVSADSMEGQKLVRLPSLNGLASFIPLPETRMYETISNIVNLKSKAGEIEAFAAFINYLSNNNTNSFEKNGIRYTSMGIKNDMFVCAIDVANQSGNWDSVGLLGLKGGFLNEMRHGNIAKNIEKASETYDKEGMKNMLSYLAEHHQAISNVEDFGDENEKAAYQNLIMEKSFGNQNLVIADPQDNTKVIKLILGAKQLEKAQLEVMANMTMRGAGFDAPKSQLVVDEKTGVAFIHMDNYRVKDGMFEMRQEYFLDMMKKDRSEAHNMNYQEMAKFLDIYERKLPDNLKDPKQLEENKQALFKWALANSAFNNTDNHGRNLGALIDDQGRLKVTPIFDVSFDSKASAMSTYIDGIPPVHKLDITNNKELEKLWKEMGMKEDVSKGLEMRDALMGSMGRIPEYAERMGLDVNSGIFEHIVSSVKVQSYRAASVIDQVVQQARIEAYERGKENKNTAESPSWS